MTDALALSSYSLGVDAQLKTFPVIKIEVNSRCFRCLVNTDCLTTTLAQSCLVSKCMGNCIKNEFQKENWLWVQ